MFKGDLIDPSVKIIAIPLLVILGTIVITIYTVNFAYLRITANLEEVGRIRKLQNTLTERVNVLKEFQAGVLDDRSDLVYTALPDKNPATAIVSQLRTQIKERELTMTGISSLAPTDFNEKIQEGEITYKVDSPDIIPILGILDSLSSIAPVTAIAEVTIVKDNSGSYAAELKLPTYWSPLPTELPSLDEPIEDLTPEERELMARILQYTFPVFVNLTPGAKSNERQNPFN